MSVDLSVVVVSYNTRELLWACLASVVANLGQHRLPDGQILSDELWVVDNASTDGSTEMVAREFPGAKLIANDENRGFAAANNMALQQSTGRYVLLLNPDTIVLDDALSRLVTFMDHHERVGAAGVKLLNPDRTLQHSCFRFPTLPMAFLDFFPLHHRLLDSRVNGRYPRQLYAGAPFPIDHPLGACFIVRRSASEQVGWLDESFFMYSEEVDWCIRLKRHGWEVYCVPEAQVIHYGAQSTQQVRGPMLVELYRSRYLYARKHHRRLYRLVFRKIVHVGVSRELRRADAMLRSGAISESDFAQRRSAYLSILAL
jgi:GT2 family glycosyltransferase